MEEEGGCPFPELTSVDVFVQNVGDVPVVDLRPLVEFETVRLQSKGGVDLVVVNLPFEDLFRKDLNRCGEMPPRNVQFDVIFPATENVEVFSFFGQTVKKSTGTSSTPWRVRNGVVGDSRLWEVCFSSKSVHVVINEKCSTPGPRLWQPDLLVESFLLALAAQLCDESLHGTSVSIFDLGSGAGRDVAFLAEELKKKGPCANVKIVGVECHKGASKRCLPLWLNRGVAEMTALECVNLKKEDEFNRILSKYGEGTVDMMYCVRYLNRSLLKRIAVSCSHEFIRPGGYFAISHFVLESDGSFPFEHPKKSEVLARGELEELFSNWKIVRSEEVRDNDFGRPMWHFCVQKIT
jgi:hypothetical protein